MQERSEIVAAQQLRQEIDAHEREIFELELKIADINEPNHPRAQVFEKRKSHLERKLEEMRQQQSFTTPMRPPSRL